MQSLTPGASPLKIELGSGSERCNSDFQAKFLKPTDKMLLDSLRLALVKIVRAEINVRGSPLDQVVGNHQKGMSDSHGGSFLAASGSQTTILSREVIVLAATSRMSRLN